MRIRYATAAAALTLGLTLSACSMIEREPAETHNVPLTPTGAYLAAQLAAGDHDAGDAAPLYRAALAGDPDNPDLLEKAFFFTALAGDMKDAAGIAQKLTLQEPGNRWARLILSADAIARSDYAGARDGIVKAAQSGKAELAIDAVVDLTFVMLKSWSEAGQGNTDAALADAATIVKRGGTDTLQSYETALILDYAGRKDAADAAYRKTLEAGVNPRAVEAYGRFMEVAGRVKEARAFYARLQTDEGVGPIAKAGLVRLESGQAPQRLIATPSRGAAEALFGIAASLSGQPSADFAILYLQLALYLAPDFDLAKIVLADRYEALTRFDLAIATFRTVPASSPYAEAASVQIAIDEGRANDNKQAAADLTTMVAAHPDDLSAWTALGDVQRSLEKYPAAADAYSHAIALIKQPAKEDWPLFYARAVAEERAGQWTAAEQDLDRSLKLSPDEPQVLNYLGYSWVDRGERYAEALGMLEKARALSPYDGYIVDSVGWAYFKLGRYRDAAETLQNAVMLVPGDSTINDHLGDAYWRVGRKLDAQFQWNHALAFGPEPAEKAKIEKKLQVGLDAGADRT